MTTRGRAARGSRRSRVAAVIVAGLVTAGCGSPAPDADGAAGSTAEGPASGTSVTGVGPQGGTFGFGEPASDEDIARWDIDVGPDGSGLPAGSGSVAEGSDVYAASCAHCHGENGEDGPYGPVVATVGAEAFPFGRDPSLVTSIGNYWPYATTVFDYVRRAMPFDDPGALSDDEVYAVTAWLLWRNGVLAEDVVLDAETLSAVEMPAKPHFVPSDDVSLTALP